MKQKKRYFVSIKYSRSKFNQDIFMNTLSYKSRELMPGVLLDKYSNKFFMWGISCPPEPFDFFMPIIKWFNEYLRKPLELTTFEIYLDYFDTITSKFLLKILYKLENLSERGYDVKIKWYYSEEDVDMYEEAEEFEYVVDLEFDIIPISKDDAESIIGPVLSKLENI